MNQNPAASPSTAPETDAGRNYTLSVITGFALLGLLVTSIWDFGGFTNQIQAFYYANAHKGNYKLLTTVSILFEGKMATLLALCFGAGIYLLVQKKATNHLIDGMEAHIRKQIWMIILGLFVGLILLFPNDLIFPFAIVGILLFAFTQLPAKNLFIVAMLCCLIYAGKNYWYYADDQSDYKAYLEVKKIEKRMAADSAARSKKLGYDVKKDSASQKAILVEKMKADSIAKKKDTLTSKQAGEKAKWEGLVKSVKHDSSRVANDRKSMQAGYKKMWFYVKDKVQYKESYWLYSIGVWEYASAMLFGMALLSIGFFQRRFTSSTYLIMALVFIVIGVAMAFFRIHTATMRINDYEKFIKGYAIPYNQLFPFEKISMAIGYASLLIWLLKLNALTWLMDIFSALGKMALTNYMLQVIIAAIWFYGYGLGYYGMFEQWELYAAVAEIALVQIVFSVFWLRYYKMGPLEWGLFNLVYQQKTTNKL
ncbi:MAG: DUF418 domain-containing protein [Sphingobacteriia bacterium]|jgi:uncharacterized protein